MRNHLQFFAEAMVKYCNPSWTTGQARSMLWKMKFHVKVIQSCNSHKGLRNESIMTDTTLQTKVMQFHRRELCTLCKCQKLRINIMIQLALKAIRIYNAIGDFSVILQTMFEFYCNWVSSEHDLKWLYILGSLCDAWYGIVWRLYCQQPKGN